MKAKSFTLARVCMMICGLLVLGCATPQKTTDAGNSSTSGAVRKNTPFSLDGYWELPEGDMFLFERKAFILLDADGDIDINGILFNQTGTQLTLHFYDNWEVKGFNISYKVLSNGNIEASFGNNTWVNGIWKKRNDLNDELKKKVASNPVLGYWEMKQEEQILIYHFSPYGFGFRYTCEPNYLLNGARGGDISFGKITFGSELPLVKFQLVSTRGDKRSSGSITMEMRCVIDGDSLLIGFGDDQSKYVRYTR